MSSQIELFISNVSGHCLSKAEAGFESSWLTQVFKELEPHETGVSSFDCFKKALSKLMPAPSPSDQFISQEITRDQFKIILRQYAADGLTEANAMFYALPKLNGEPQWLLMKILQDEFGGGNFKRTHQQLYKNLLQSVSLPNELSAYIAAINAESYALVNIYYWLTKRAARIDFYLGALAFTEMSIPIAFKPFVEACERLGIQEKAYFTEHTRIDIHHTRLALQVIERLWNTGTLDLNSALLGARLAKLVGERAFDAALRQAMLLKEVVNG